MPAIIRRHNDSVGTPDTNSSGCHETITHCYTAGVASFLRRIDAALPLVGKVNALLNAREGQRDWPLRFYTRERLFPAEAQRHVLAPDLCALPV